MKISLSSILSGFFSTTQLNNNFQLLKDELNNKVLYRNNPVGEPNEMQSDLDMNGFRILNTLAQSGDGFIWKGVWTTNTTYQLNNLVYVSSGSFSGSSFIAKSTHLSGASFDVDKAAGKWETIAQRGGAGAGSGDMISTNNLSDVANAASARTNLGLNIGTNVMAQTDFATQAEAEAGTENTKIITALRVAQAIAAFAGLVRTTGNQTIDGVKTFTSTPIVPTLGSIRLVGVQGRGSVNTRIYRFLTPVYNIGTDITYTDSATLGASFLINNTGIYSVTWTDQFAQAAFIGLSVNSNQLSTNINLINNANVLTADTSLSSGNPVAVSWTGNLSSGDVIRAHAGIATQQTAVTGFTITRIK